MTIGTITYVPNGGFAAPRSYFDVFNLNVTAVVTRTGNTFTFPDGSLPTRIFTVILQDRFVVWSSNRYTLDFVIAESYYQEFPVTTKLPLAATVRWSRPAPDYLSTITFYPFGIIFPDDHNYNLPPAPPGYWLPPHL